MPFGRLVIALELVHRHGLVESKGAALLPPEVLETGSTTQCLPKVVRERTDVEAWGADDPARELVVCHRLDLELANGDLYGLRFDRFLPPRQSIRADAGNSSWPIGRGHLGERAHERRLIASTSSRVMAVVPPRRMPSATTVPVTS